jgi:hypothetical protein
MDSPPELSFEDVTDLRRVSDGRPSWFLDQEQKPTLFDEVLADVALFV